jgi:transposase
VSCYLSQLDTADRQPKTEALVAKTSRLKEKYARLEVEMQRLKGFE